MDLKTQRCAVRCFEEKDLDAFMSYRNDMEWMQYQGFKGKSKEEYREALLREQHVDEGAQYAVEHTESGTLIGDIYLKQEGSGYWIGYTIAPAFARQGYAGEVASGVVARLKEKGCSAVYAGAEPENKASMRLLEKLGFSCVQEINGEKIYRMKL